MSSFQAYAVPFALLCKLCGAPDDGLEPDPTDPPSSQIDGAVAPGASDAAVPSARDASATVSFDGASAPAADASSAVVPGPGSPFDAAVAIAACPGPPGLYREGACSELAVGVRPYAPRFTLWSDGSTKERFVQLPPSSVIDGSEGDAWTFPTGTRLYKTFALNGVKLETRVMEKSGSGRGVDSWTFRAYAWNPEQTAVALVEESGRMNVLGTAHDIPSVAQCRSCHSAAGQDGANGFSAIQLNHADAGVSLSALLSEQRLSSPHGAALVELAKVPGDAVTQAGLGVLHANCGHCHGGPTPRAQLTLRLTVGQLDLTSSAVYRSAVGAPLGVWTGRSRPDGVPLLLRAAPGDAAVSGIVARMSTRGTRDQMPPLGSEVVDAAGLTAVSAMIDHLSAGISASD
jgi:hypothetical protein